MNTVLVLTIGDIVGILFFGILFLFIGKWAFDDWKNSPKRLWNRKK